MTHLHMLNVGYVVLAAVLGLGVVKANGDPIRVPKDKPTIQGAIDAANDGDVIVVSPGTYSENIDFCGKKITVQSTKTNDPNTISNTIIKGDSAASTVAFWHSEDAGAKLVGLTIAGAPSGEAIRCMGSSPEITRCRIVGDGVRPVVHCERGSPAFTRCDVGLSRVTQDKTVVVRCLDTTARFARCPIIQPKGADPYGGLNFINLAPRFGVGQDYVLSPAAVIGGLHFVASFQTVVYSPGAHVQTIEVAPHGWQSPLDIPLDRRPWWNPPDPQFEPPPDNLQRLLSMNWTMLTEPQRKRVQRYLQTHKHSGQ